MAKNTVLIVDDKDINRVILHNMLATEYDVIEAADGQEAVYAIDAHKADIACILLDIIMPVMDGFGVLEHMKNSGLSKSIPVIIITGDESLATEAKADQYEVSDIIGKPLAPKTVKRRVKNVIQLYASKQELEEIANGQKEIISKQYQQLERQNKELQKTNESMIEALSCIVEFRNVESGRHIKRIKCLTRVLASTIAKEFPEYEIDEKKIDLITNASALHDVGKIAIPDAILLKPGRLTAEEFEIMKKHSMYGCRIIESFDFIKDKQMYDYSYQIARWHHEKFDGHGYPDGLKGDQIPICAQIVSISDVYEALVSKRCYKDAYSHLDACKMIVMGECGVFNPKLLQCFDIAKNDFRLALEKYDENNAAPAPRSKDE